MIVITSFGSVLLCCFALVLLVCFMLSIRETIAEEE